MSELRSRLRVWQIPGLGYVNAARCRLFLHWGWRQRKTTPGGSIRLSHHTDHTMAGPEERLKTPCGKFRSAGKEDIHGCGTRSGLARNTALRQSSNNESAGSQPASGRLAELFLKFR